MKPRHAQRNFAAIAALIGVCVVATLTPFAFGAQFSALGDEIIRNAESGHLALPGAIAFFVCASFIGAPQPLLVAACVLACGPWDGFVYSWVATVAAAVTDYGLGYWARRFAVKSVDGFAHWRVMRVMQERPFLASLLIRNAPTAPFLVVNMAFGLARANFWRFFAGLVLGVAPKTAVVAFGAKAVIAAISGNAPIAALAAAACLAIASAGAVMSGRFLRRDEGDFANAEAASAFSSPMAGSVE